jgi:hypothetical protein
MIRKLLLSCLLTFGVIVGALGLSANPAAASYNAQYVYLDTGWYYGERLACWIGLEKGETPYGYPYVRVRNLGYGAVVCESWSSWGYAGQHGKMAAEIEIHGQAAPWPGAGDTYSGKQIPYDGWTINTPRQGYAGGACITIYQWRNSSWSWVPVTGQACIY